MKQGKLFCGNCKGMVKWEPSKPQITPSIIFSLFIAPATEGHYQVYKDCHYFCHSLNKSWSAKGAVEVCWALSHISLS